MKLSNVQKHYYTYFQNRRKEFKTKNSNFKYWIPPNFSNDKLSKVLQQFQQYKNANLFRVDSKRTEHALNTTSTIPESFDIEIYIHNTPIIIMFDASKLYGFTTHSTKEQYFPYMFGDDHIDPHPYSTNIMHDQRYGKFIYQSQESKKFITVLNEYIIDHKMYSEEELFQLQLLLPDPHIYIAVNELRLHIARNINKNSSIVEVLNHCTVLNYTNTNTKLKNNLQY